MGLKETETNHQLSFRKDKQKSVVTVGVYSYSLLVAALAAMRAILVCGLCMCIECN
jgi:hypothetical protein